MPKPDLFIGIVNKIVVIKMQVLFFSGKKKLLFTMSNALFVGVLIQHCVKEKVQEF